MHVERKLFPDDVELAYGVWTPKEKPRGVVLCIHGIRSHAGWYERSCKFFADKGYVTYFLDRRGSGLNRDDAIGAGGKLTASLLVADLVYFVTRIRLEHPQLPVHLVAISWGGKLAVATLLQNPELVDSLTLVAPGGIAARKDISIGHKLRVLLYRFTCPGKMMPIPLNEPELFTANPEKIEYIRHDELALTECPAALMWTSFILDCRIRRAAEKLTVPVFMMLAEHDEICDNEKLMSFYAQLGSTSKQVKIYSGAHHTLEFEPEPEPIFDDMTNWFSSFDGGKR